jgi:hypothetical protein
VEQGCVSEYAIKRVFRKCQFEKILTPDLTSCLLSSHIYKLSTAVNASGPVPELFKCYEVASWTTAQIENIVWGVTFYMPE